jgi:hypothetical protein
MRYKVIKTNEIGGEPKVSFSGLEYTVKATKTIYGERTSVDESEPNEYIITYPFSGCLCDCYSWVKLTESGQI